MTTQPSSRIQGIGKRSRSITAPSIAHRDGIACLSRVGRIGRSIPTTGGSSRYPSSGTQMSACRGVSRENSIAATAGHAANMISDRLLPMSSPSLNVTLKGNDDVNPQELA